MVKWGLFVILVVANGLMVVMSNAGYGHVIESRSKIEQHFKVLYLFISGEIFLIASLVIVVVPISKQS